MGSPLNLALPDFGPSVDAEELNHRLKAYKRWGYDQRRKGHPIPCWCLHLWIKGNNKAASARRVRVIHPPRIRPEGSTSTTWQNWKAHQRNGGGLSFQEYQAKHSARKALALAAPAPVSPSKIRKQLKKVKSSGGAVLRRPLQEILAKFEAMGKLPKGGLHG